MLKFLSKLSLEHQHYSFAIANTYAPSNTIHIGTLFWTQKWLKCAYHTVGLCQSLITYYATKSCYNNHEKLVLFHNNPTDQHHHSFQLLSKYELLLTSFLGDIYFILQHYKLLLYFNHKFSIWTTVTYSNPFHLSHTNLARGSK